jgi:hypothetical protein
MNPRAEALRAELERRGTLKPKGGIAGIPPSGREERIKALRDELQRRAATENSGTFWEDVKQAGPGAVSGALKTGMGIAMADPYVNEAKMWMSTQPDIAPYAEQHDEMLKAGQEALDHQEAEKLKDMSVRGRIAYKAGDWVGSGLATPGGNFLKGAPLVSTVPAMIREVAKKAGQSLGRNTAIGTTSGVLQEGGMNPLGADLVSGAVNPGIIGTGKLLKKAGQSMRTPRERKTAWALSKIYTQKAPEIGESRPAHTAFNVPEALAELSPVATGTEAGTQLRGTLAHELETRKKLREAQAAPFYKAVEQNTQGHPIPETRQMIEDMLAIKGGETAAVKRKLQQALESSTVRLTPPERKNKEMVENFIANNPWAESQPEVLARLRETYPYPQLEQTAHEVNEVLKQSVQPMIRNTYDGTLKGKLQNIKESLLKETSTVPELKKARKIWSKHSEGVNRIESNPLLKLTVETDPYGKYIFGESDLPKKVINPSLHSLEDARALLKEIKGHPQTVKATRGYIHGQVIDAITDGYGKVSHEKLQGWKRKNPGAFVVDPSLETKLKNLSNSQYLVNQARLKINNSSLKDTFTHFGLKAGAKFLPGFVGKDKMIELLSFKLADDIQGKDELITKVIQSPQFQQLLDTKPCQISKMEKLVKALTPAMRNALVASMRGQVTEKEER